MKVSTKGRYALRFMIDLAQNDGQENCISLKDISGRQHISLKYLEQIVTNLNRAGLVKSVRGAQGGYRLTRSPEEYTVGEILRSMEGSLAPVSCLESERNECENKDICPALPFWKGLDQVVTDYVDSVTLDQLI